MVEILEEPYQLVVRIGGHEYVRYQFPQDAYKPFMYPIRAANGLSMVADCPSDHRHHHGFWIGHGRVNGQDFWLERETSGRIVQQEYRIDSGVQSASIHTVNQWIDPQSAVVLNDVRSFTFYDMPVHRRWFDLELRLTPTGPEDVLLHPSNEAGIPHMRVAEGLSVSSGGRLTNAQGLTDERGTYRQPSAWVDCSGTLGRRTCGIAIMDHPDNPAHPTRWFTRDYGPFSPNYGFFMRNPIRISNDTPLHLRYRIVTHSGDVTTGDVAGAWQDYLREAQP